MSVADPEHNWNLSTKRSWKYDERWYFIGTFYQISGSVTAEHDFNNRD